MNNNTKIIMALLSASIMLVGGGAMLLHDTDDVNATSKFISINPTNDLIHIVSVGHAFSLDLGYFYSEGDVQINSKPTWISLSGNTITGSAPTIGNYVVTYVFLEPGGYTTESLVRISVVDVGDVELRTIVYKYDYKTIAIDYNISNTVYVIPTFFDVNHGWYSEGYSSNSNDTSCNAFDSVNFKGTSHDYAGLPISTIMVDNFVSTEPTDAIDFTGQNFDVPNVVNGINFSHKLVNETGVTISVTGNLTSWIHVSDNKIYGVPPSDGEYTVNVEISKDGYNTINETFTITVVGLLVVTNSPLNGAYYWV